MPDSYGKTLNSDRPVGEMGEMSLTSVATGENYASRHEIMFELANRVGGTCNLNAPMGNDIVYLDRAEADWPLRMQLPIGTRVPLHCTASGKLHLSSLPDAERERLVRGLFLEKLTEKTITDADTLFHALDKIRESGIGTDDEEFIEGMTAIAVALNDQKGRIIAILACHAPSAQMNMQKAMEHVPVLRRAAENIRQTLVKPTP